MHKHPLIMCTSTETRSLMLSNGRYKVVLTHCAINNM